MVGCSVGLENLCLDNLDANADGSVVGWGVLVEVLVLLYGFLAVAIIADNHLVTSLETLCVRWNVREDVAGASFMAFGSAAPEIIINAVSTIKTVLAVSDGGAAAVAPEDAGEDTDLGIGAIIGSGMIAFTVIPGVCGLAAKEDLALKRRPLARDTGFYSLALALLCYAISDGLVEVHEAAVMVTLYVVYIAIVVFSSGVRRRRRAIPAAQFLCAIRRRANSSLTPRVPPPQVRQLYRVRVLGRAPRAKQSFVTQAHIEAESGLQPLGSPAAQAAGLQPPGPGGEDPRPPPMAVATPVAEAEAAGLWDALPIQPSPMEFSPLDISASMMNLKPPEPKETPFTKAVAALMRAGGVALVPLNLALKVTCPPCEHDGPHAKWYPVTFAMAFAWVAFLSTVISAVVSRWGDLLGVSPAFLGMYIIAVGAEIPDTIQSVTVARRGYGSMAVSNSTGSQIINILIGLGLPWLISTMASVPVPVHRPAQILQMAAFQGANVFLYLSLVLFVTWRTWRRGDHSKASLGRRKGAALVALYVVVLSVYAAINFT